jgi:hypothetical protein
VSLIPDGIGNEGGEMALRSFPKPDKRAGEDVTHSPAPVCFRYSCEGEEAK